MVLTEKDAAIAYAKAWNTLNCSEFIELLEDDAHYASQWVLSELEGKTAISEYFTAKIESVRKSGSKVYAELGVSGASYKNGHYLVILSQGDKDNTKSVVVFDLKGNKISRYDMCMPGLFSPERTGKYPT